MKWFIIVSLLVKVWQQRQLNKEYRLELYRIVESIQPERVRVNIRAAQNQ